MQAAREAENCVPLNTRGEALATVYVWGEVTVEAIIVVGYLEVHQVVLERMLLVRRFVEVTDAEGKDCDLLCIVHIGVAKINMT